MTRSGIGAVNVSGDSKPPAGNEAESSGCRSQRVGTRWGQRGGTFENLPREGRWTYFLGPRYGNLVEIGETDELRTRLAERQQRFAIDLQLLCLIEGALAEEFAERFADQHQRAAWFAIKGPLRGFLAQNRLEEPVSLRPVARPRPPAHGRRGPPMHPNSPEAQTSDEMYLGMPMWVLYRHLND